MLKGAVFVALLAYNALSLREAVRAAAQAFLVPAGAGAPHPPGVPLPADALAAHSSLRFVADMHASPMMSTRDVLVRRTCAALACVRSRVVPQPGCTRTQSQPAVCPPCAGARDATLHAAQVFPEPRGA